MHAFGTWKRRGSDRALTDKEMVLKVAIITFLVKFLFSAVSFGSGAPGGIFFPLLILGAMVGGIFSMTGTEIFGLDPMYMNNFVLLAMADFSRRSFVRRSQGSYFCLRCPAR